MLIHTSGNYLSVKSNLPGEKTFTFTVVDGDLSASYKIDLPCLKKLIVSLSRTINEAEALPTIKKLETLNDRL